MPQLLRRGRRWLGALLFAMVSLAGCVLVLSGAAAWYEALADLAIFTAAGAAIGLAVDRLLKEHDKP